MYDPSGDTSYYSSYLMNWDDGKKHCETFSPAATSCPQCTGMLATIHTKQQDDLINDSELVNGHDGQYLLGMPITKKRPKNSESW